MRKDRIALAVAVVCSCSNLVFAEEQVTDSVTTLPAVTVTADRESTYIRTITNSATKMDTPMKELPASVHVVTEDLIRDLAIVKPSELVSLVPSVQQNVGYGGVGSQDFFMRGFNNGAVNYRNGYRSSDKYVPRDMANVERIDFVMGPSSATYGNAPPAGAVNTITKTPFFGNANNVTFSAGSWSSMRGTGDFNWSSGDLAVRLNVASDKANSFIDYEKPQNALLAPSFLYRIDSGTEIMYAMEYFKTRVDGFSNGLPMADGVFDLRKGATSSMPWAQFNNENLSHRVEFKTKINDDWLFRQGVYSERTKQNYRGVSPAFDQYSSGTSLNSYGLIYNAGPKNDHDTDVIQSEINGSMDLFGQRHRAVLGYEFARSRFTYSNYNESYTSAGTFSSPTASNSFTGEVYLTQSNSKTNAIYINDQLKLGQLNVLLGLRNDWIETSDLTTTQLNSAISSRVGLLYPLTNQTSMYYSLGQSFVPNLGTSASGGVLAPEKGLQNEVGIKYAISPSLNATFAVFDIVKTNVARSELTYYILDGEQKSRGVEATLNGRVTSSLQLIANFSYLDYAKITIGTNAGSSLYGAAKHTFNLWAIQGINSDLPGELSIGLGLSNVSDRPADSKNSGFKLPSYTKLDAGVFYKHQKVRYALNIKNLNDAKVFDTAEGYFVQRQMPRSFVATVSLDF
jgi:iron complex outermembrane receptor protein